MLNFYTFKCVISTMFMQTHILQNETMHQCFNGIDTNTVYKLSLKTTVTCLFNKKGIVQKQLSVILRKKCVVSD